MIKKGFAFGHCGKAEAFDIPRGLFRRLAMNIAAVADPQRGLAAVRRAATFGAGYLQGILAIIFCEKMSKNFS